jgi:hypothetical protein
VILVWSFGQAKIFFVLELLPVTVTDLGLIFFVKNLVRQLRIFHSHSRVFIVWWSWVWSFCQAKIICINLELLTVTVTDLGLIFLSKIFVRQLRIFHSHNLSLYCMVFWVWSFCPAKNLLRHSDGIVLLDYITGNRFQTGTINAKSFVILSWWFESWDQGCEHII